LMLSEFAHFVGKTSCCHWGPIESIEWKDALTRHKSLKHHIEWVDLCYIFTNIPITIKGCLTFKLKHIAKVLYDNGYIETCWDDNMKDGLECAIYALKEYNKTSPNLDIIKKY